MCDFFIPDVVAGVSRDIRRNLGRLPISPLASLGAAFVSNCFIGPCACTRHSAQCAQKRLRDDGASCISPRVRRFLHSRMYAETPISHYARKIVCSQVPSYTCVAVWWLTSGTCSLSRWPNHGRYGRIRTRSRGVKSNGPTCLSARCLYDRRTASR